MRDGPIRWIPPSPLACRNQPTTSERLRTERLRSERLRLGADTPLPAGNRSPRPPTTGMRARSQTPHPRARTYHTNRPNPRRRVLASYSGPRDEASRPVRVRNRTRRVRAWLVRWAAEAPVCRPRPGRRAWPGARRRTWRDVTRRSDSRAARGLLCPPRTITFSRVFAGPSLTKSVSRGHSQVHQEMACDSASGRA